MSIDYSRSPITEAIVEVIFERTISQEDRQKIADKFKSSYPETELINHFDFKVDQQFDTTNFTLNHDVAALKLISNNRDDVMIVGFNVLGVARAAPYTGWDNLIERFKSGFSARRKIEKKTSSVKLVSIRNINRIDIPLDNGIDVSKYLNFYPYFSDSIDDSPNVDDYLIRITKKYKNTDWYITIVSASAPSVVIGMESLIFDIQVFRDKNIPAQDERLFSMIDEAREIKNEVFENYVNFESLGLSK